jgi:hypothetical protein
MSDHVNEYLNELFTLASDAGVPASDETVERLIGASGAGAGVGRFAIHKLWYYRAWPESTFRRATTGANRQARPSACTDESLVAVLEAVS